MKDCTPPIYLGVNSTPCTQLLSIYNKNCRAYISAALEPLHGLSNYRTELNRESKIIPIQVRWGEGTAACQMRSQVGANGYRAGEAFTESLNQPPSVITRRGLHHCRRSTVSSYMATLWTSYSEGSTNFCWFNFKDYFLTKLKDSIPLSILRQNNMLTSVIKMNKLNILRKKL